MVAVLEFFQRLKRHFSGWDWENNQTSISRLAPISSSFKSSSKSSKLILTDVTFGTHLLEKAENSNNYKSDTSSLKFDLQPLFDNANSSVVNITFGEKNLRDKKTIPLKKEGNKEFFISKNHKNIDEVLQNIREGFWRENFTLCGSISPSRENKETGELKIKAFYEQKNPINAKGIAVSYDRSRHITKIFFDISDEENKDCLSPYQAFEFEHEKIIKEEAVKDTFKIYEDKIWHVNIIKKAVYKVYPDSYSTDQWNLSNLLFRKAPSFKEDVPLKGEDETFPKDAFEGNLVEHFYKIVTTQNTDDTKYYRKNDFKELGSNYIYSNGKGKFQPIGYFEEQWADSENPEHKISLKYLLRYEQPEFEFHEKVQTGSNSGEGHFPQGLYKLKNTGSADSQYWQSIEPTTHEVNFVYSKKKGLFHILKGDPYKEPKIFRKIEKCCPIQDIILPRIDKASPLFCTAAPEWKKITIIDLSRQSLKDDQWREIFRTLTAHLGYLHSLDLSHNGFRSSLLYDIENLLESLKELKLLKIQEQLFTPDELFSLYKTLLGNESNLEELHIDKISELSLEKGWFRDNQTTVNRRKEMLEEITFLHKDGLELHRTQNDVQARPKSYTKYLLGGGGVVAILGGGGWWLFKIFK